MSTIAISYNELESAQRDAKKVAQKLNSYADSINRKVLSKLNSYSGDHTGNISSACEKMNEKKQNLQAAAQQYNDYATSLKNVKSDCISIDKSVANNIRSLSGTFKSSYGIRNKPVTNFFGNLLTSISNSNPVFRWVDNNVIDAIKKTGKSLVGSIKEWFDYDGGKQLLQGAGVATLEIALGVIGIIGAVVSGAGLVLVIAGVVAGVIGVANGVTNLVNEAIAYHARQNGDASTGYRFSAMNEYTQTLRTLSDSKGVHRFADVVDTVEFVCNVIDVVHGADELLKNGYKWVTNSADELSKISRKDILTGSTAQKFLDKVKMNVGQGFEEIKNSIKRRDFKFVKDKSMEFISDFKKTLQENYTFDSKLKNKDKIFENKLDVVKNVLSFTKGTLEDGFLPTFRDELLLPSVSIISVNNWKTDEAGTVIRDSHGNLQLGDPEDISLKDIMDNVKGGFELVFKDYPEYREKLSIPSKEVYLVRTTYIPEVHIDIKESIYIPEIRTMAA